MKRPRSQESSEHDRHYRVRSGNLTHDNVDFLMEIRVKDSETLLKELNQVKGVTSVSLVAHKGESVY